MAHRISWLVFVVLIGAASSAGPAWAATAKELSGKYELKGTNPDGTKYEGSAEITFEKGNTVKVNYKIGKRSDIALGKLEGEVLTVSYEGTKSDRTGKATYELKKSGVLHGTWHDKGSKPGTETLTPKK